MPRGRTPLYPDGLPPDVAARYVSGELPSAAAVGCALGVSRPTARRLLAAAGVTRPAGGGSSNRVRWRRKAQRNARVLALRARGLTFAAIAEQIGTTHQNVQRIVRRWTASPGDLA